MCPSIALWFRGLFNKTHMIGFDPKFLGFHSMSELRSKSVFIKAITKTTFGYKLQHIRVINVK